MRSPGRLAVLAFSAGISCGPNGGAQAASTAPHFPLVRLVDVPLPVASARFDYQDIDAAEGHLVVAHMGDASVLVLRLSDGSLVRLLSGIPTPRGVAVASDLGRFFVTSSPSTLVLIDSQSLVEIARVPTGSGPDGLSYDPVEHVVAVSDQHDGALSLLAEGGQGTRTQVALGAETGNVVFDSTRHVFWVAVVVTGASDELVSVDPRTQKATTHIALSGCGGPHGVRLHPDGRSAFVACESNDVLVRVELDGNHSVVSAATGKGPDVLAIDPGLGWLYVAAESGDLAVFDMAQPGLAVLEREQVGDHAHTVAVDPATHRVFFPLELGPGGKPVLRILQPRAL